MSVHKPGIEVEDCVRHKIVIDGEAGYLTLGKTFVSVTLPDENKFEVQKARHAVDAVCNKLTDIMGGSNA